MMFGDELEMQTDSVQREECVLGKTLLEVPQELCEKEDLLLDMLNMDTWEKVLTNEQRAHLMNYLPVFPENDDVEKQNTIRKLFSGDNFKFGNPVHQFHKKLHDGQYSANMQKMTSLIRKAKHKDYRYQQQRYYFKLLQDVLISRKKLLEAASKLPPDQPIKMERLQPRITNSCIEQHTKKRYFRELEEMREEVGEVVTSSEDENYPEGSPPKLTKKQKKQLFHFEAALSPDMARITSTMSPKSTSLENGGHSSCSSHRSMSPFEVTEEYYRELLLRHKRRRHERDEHPDLDTVNITLQEVVMRTSMIKRTTPRPDISTNNRKKGKDKLEKKKKKSKSATVTSSPALGVQVSAMVTPLSSAHVDDGPVSQKRVDLIDFEKVKVKIEDTKDQVAMEVDANGDDYQFKSTAKSIFSTMSQDTFPSFFSLIREIICRSPDQRIASPKLEEEVRAWQESTFAPLNEWYTQQMGWSEQVTSTLKFLAGDFPGVHSDSFVPYIDYKEKIQMWQWIGVGRDSDENMSALCKTWLDNKDDASTSDAIDNGTGSPPPARIQTEWMVRPTSEEERGVYREQERRRYENPHKAYTFRMHDYESVVGPVKGVYGKDGAMNKAREHSLLVSDRPPFVTILSLVRDAASRLPNGEGTRADICELLKDSQYLSVTADSQVHTVVSGALDRLHYEKDPCVKYDVNRKLWIYLHRNRTEEEFERIHQAHAAAAKAKKSVHKPKVPRTTKGRELPRPASAHSPGLLENATILEVSTSNVLTTQSISPGTTTVAFQRSSVGGSGVAVVGGIGMSSPRAQQPSPKTGPPVKPVRNSQSGGSKPFVPTSVVIPQVAGTIKGSLSAPLIQAQIQQQIQQQTVVRATPLLEAIPNSTQVVTTTSNSASFVLPQSLPGSRPSSTGSAQSLPSPKAVIANVNAAQFVSVSQVQIAPGTISPKAIPSPAPSSQPKTVSNLLNQQQALQKMMAKQQQQHHHPQGCIASLTTTSSQAAAVAAAKAAALASTVKLVPTVSHSDILLGKPPIISSTIGQPSLQGLQTIMIKQDAAAQMMNSAAGVQGLPPGSTMANSIKGAMTAGNKPVVARIIANPQVVSVGNLIASTLAATHKQAPSLPGATTIKIQGGNLIHRPGLSGKPRAMNVIQATTTTAGGAVGLPRLAVVTQGAGGNLIPVTCATVNAQPKLVAAASGQLGVMTSQLSATQQAHLTAATKPTFLTTARGMKILSAATSGVSLAQFGAKPGMVVTTKPNSSAVAVTMSGTVATTVPASSVILTGGGMQTSSPTVVIAATQGALKPTGAQTVVMAATNTSAQTVVMAAQAGMRPIAAVTPVNMKALQSVKVIPMSQTQGSKGKTQPVFARIITPPAGLTLQSAGALAAAQQGISVIQSVAALPGTPTTTHVRSMGASSMGNPLTATPTTIIRLQAPSTTQADVLPKDK